MKFVHVSNVNLDGAPKSDRPWDAHREEEFNEDFRRMLYYCADINTDALFITGNLFAHAPSEDDLVKLDVMFLSLHSIRVFWVFGRNEETETFAKIKNYRWMSNVSVFAGDSLERVYISEFNVEITCVGYNSKTWPKVAQTEFSRGSRAGLQILLLPFVGDGRSSAALTSLNLPFDYIGVGQEAYYKGNDEKRVFSVGMFEPTDFTAQTRHGFFEVELTSNVLGDSTLNVRLIPNAKREYIVLQVNAGIAASFEDVEAQVKSAIEKFGPDNIYRIQLKGEASAEVLLNKEKLAHLGNIAEIEDMTDSALLQQTLAEENEIGEALKAFKMALPENISEDVMDRAVHFAKDALLAVRTK